MSSAEYMRKWVAKNHEHHLETRRVWKKNNPESVKKSNQTYYEEIKNDPIRYENRRIKARQWKKNNPEKVYISNRNSHLKKNYDITLEEYNNLLANQNNCCAICGVDNPQSATGWHLDHDHETGEVRGILCQPCNHMLGGAKDKIDILEKAITYLIEETKENNL